MVQLEHVTGDLFTCGATVLVQQLNCLAVRGRGLSAAMARAYPYANVYGRRTPVGKRNLATPATRGVPGEIVVSHPAHTLFSMWKADSSSSTLGNIMNPIIVGLYGQYEFGTVNRHYTRRISDAHPAIAEGGSETSVQRLAWFSSALTHLGVWMRKHAHASVAFPNRIGCSLAGGDWDAYLDLIENFARDAPFKTYCVYLPRDGS